MNICRIYEPLYATGSVKLYSKRDGTDMKIYSAQIKLLLFSCIEYWKALRE